MILVSLGHPQLDHLDMEMVTGSLATLGKFTFAALSQIICTFPIVTQYVHFLKLSLFFSTSGGMLMDPFRAGGMGSTGVGPSPRPGQLPRLLIFSL